MTLQNSFFTILNIISLLCEILLGYFLLIKVLTLKTFRACRLCTCIFPAVHAVLLLTEEYSITARAAVSISVMLRKNLWKYLTAPVPPDDIRCETQS